MNNIKDNKLKWANLIDEYELILETEKLKLKSKDTSYLSQSSILLK